MAPQQPRRWEVVPGELPQCFVCVDLRLCHCPADLFACELNVWSIQCNEQNYHASALAASGLVSWQVSSCKRLVPKYGPLAARSVLQAMVTQNKRSTCRLSPSCVIISARPASDHLQVNTRFKIHISRLWCAAGSKYPRSFMMNLLLTCCLYHSRSTSAPSPTWSSPCTEHQNRRVLRRYTHGEYAPCEKWFTSQLVTHSEFEGFFSASRVQQQHLLSRKHCDGSKPTSFGVSLSTLQ